MEARIRELEAALDAQYEQWREHPPRRGSDVRDAVARIVQDFSDVPDDLRSAVLQRRASSLWHECLETAREVARMADELADELEDVLGTVRSGSGES